MAPRTAQDAFAELIRDYVGPTLRRLGFKGSGGSWTADRPGYFVALGFQRSVWGDRLETRFTMNVTVASIDVWNAARESRPYLPARPAPNTVYGSDIWQRRIGDLLPGHRDHWWTINPGSDLAALARDVTAAIAAHAVPAIQRQLSGS